MLLFPLVVVLNLQFCSVETEKLSLVAVQNAHLFLKWKCYCLLSLAVVLILHFERVDTTGNAIIINYSCTQSTLLNLGSAISISCRLLNTSAVWKRNNYHLWLSSMHTSEEWKCYCLLSLPVVLILYFKRVETLLLTTMVVPNLHI